VPTGSETAVAKSVSLASTGATTQNITVTGTTSTLKVSNAVTGLGLMGLVGLEVLLHQHRCCSNCKWS
jgi:hypothetical protein